jgi:hypothetical protein
LYNFPSFCNFIFLKFTQKSKLYAFLFKMFANLKKRIIMKKFILTATAFALAASAPAQLKVDATGNTLATGNIYLESAANFLGTTTDAAPVIFRVNGFLAGYTGAANTANVALGYRALYASTTGGALAAGTYFYSLYVGSNLMDTKKMVLTK